MRRAGLRYVVSVDDFEPMAAQARTHQEYLDAVDLLREAKASGNDAEIRRASSVEARAKVEWHRLVQLAEEADRKRHR